jgi:hypothetical protein
VPCQKRKFDEICSPRSFQTRPSEDIRKAGGGQAAVIDDWPEQQSGCLLVGSLQNEEFRRLAMKAGVDFSQVDGQWEAYLLRTFGEREQNLLICGSDDRGTMWGIYDFSEQVLGIDPLYIWTGHSPVPVGELSVESMHVVSPPPTFQFRGWFINDEDLLTGWMEGGGKRHIDYPFYGQVVHPQVMDKVIETALRLKQNLLIPASFIDLDNPAEEKLVRQAAQRGMFISQHHVEPMGVSHFTWDRYWRGKGEDFPASYVTHPEKFAEIWTEYARKWAAYPNVVWQLGLRGRADKPVWVSDPAAPASMEERGALISSALAKQMEIIGEVLGHSHFYSTATLWMEGTQLHRDGFLQFPGDTIIVFADHGPSQMLGEDFHEAPRSPARAYGVYYHAAFWPCGPHLVQGNPPDKIYGNYSQIVDSGATAYSILNVGNIREVVLGIRAVARMTWDFAAFDHRRFMESWCGMQFGGECAMEAAELYSHFYQAYHCVRSGPAPGRLLLLDGVIKLLGLSFIEAKDLSVKGWFEEMYYDFDCEAERVRFYKQAIGDSLARWESVNEAAHRLRLKIREDRRVFYEEHILVQAETAMGLHAWLYSLLLAREGSEDCLFRYYAGEACRHLEQVLVSRKKAEQEPWSGWYRGETKLDVQELLQRTRELLL